MKLDVIIPVYNEFENLKKLFFVIKQLKNFDKIKIYICYDEIDDECILKKKNLEAIIQKNLFFVKNNKKGPTNAIKEGLKNSSSDYALIYPADDFLNIKLVDSLFLTFEGKQKFDVIVFSRFIKGGSMINCSFIKKTIVFIVAYSLKYIFFFPFSDPTNGLRCFSRKVINNIPIESENGFTFSFELLLKSHLKNYPIKEIPSIWKEREVGKSNFKILKWAPDYLRWYFMACFRFFYRNKY